jgi:LysR family glycine cleavage system transcriptional activator
VRRLPPLNATRAFEVAARHVSFTKAAQELHVTHGAVSRQVAALEDWLGTKLFWRGPVGLTLTDAGRRYQQDLTVIFDRLSSASADVVRNSGPVMLRLNVPPTFATRWLMARWSAFGEEQTAELRLTTSVAPVISGEAAYDIAVRAQSGDVPGWRSIDFMTEYSAPVCHPILQERAPLRTPGDLSAHTLISYGTEPYDWASWFEAAESQLSPKQPTIQFEQMYLALQATQERMGIAIVPLFLVLDDLVAGRLCLPFGTLGLRRRVYRAFYRGDIDGSPLVADFCRWIRGLGEETERSTQAWAASIHLDL